MIERVMKKVFIATLVAALVAVIVLIVAGKSVVADAPSCWFLEDWNTECDGWCEPGNASCDWPYADFAVGLPGTAWGGEADENLNLSFGNPDDAGWAWGPFYCSATGIINISVEIKATATSGAAVGLFAEDSEVIHYGGGMWYDNSVYFGTNGYPLHPSCPYQANFFALGVDWNCTEAACSDSNCVGGVCSCSGPFGCVFFFNTSGPAYDECLATVERNQWLSDGAVPDGNWHEYAISFDTATGDTECFFDGEYMGIVHADDMAGQNLYFQLYGIGVTGDTVYWDNFLLDSGDGQVQQSVSGQRPLDPTGLLVDNISNTCMYNSTPNMSCIAWHTTSTLMNYQQIMVATDSGFNYKVWDTGVEEIDGIYSGQRSDVIYNGSSLVWNTRYYWRTRFVDCYGVVGDWSDTEWFVYGVVGCGTFNGSDPHGVFPSTDIDWYSEECSPSIFLKESWEAGATAMGFACPRTFEQMILGLCAIPIGFAAALAVGHIWVGLLAMLLWFGGLAGMGVYPWWIIIAISTFIMALWFTLRRVGN